MGKLFGTDGIRGIANEGLDAELAYQVGLAAAAVLAEGKSGAKPVFTIGSDTRISCSLLKGALIAGLCTAGADVLDLGVIPTPAVAWMTVSRGADAGIVISASHNPYAYNGIKIFSREGYKLSDELEGKIEDIVLEHRAVPRRTGGEIGSVSDLVDEAALEYVAHLTETVQEDLAGLRVLVDCANGASYRTAPMLFARYPGLKTDFIHARPSGVNINDGCGSTNLEDLSARVRDGGYDFGIAFDGDADRCLTVDETGGEIDGDKTLAICGESMKRRGKLNGSAIVGTVMSNIGLRLYARKNGLQFIAAAVGDRNVLEEMLKNGYRIGGEQSGHTIFLEYATTGDGELTALQLLQILCRSGKKASELASVCKKYPQTLFNVAVQNNGQKKIIMADPVLKEKIEEEERRLNGKGRILVRPSGTEALLRVMVEGEDPVLAESCARNLTNYIKSII